MNPQQVIDCHVKCEHEVVEGGVHEISFEVDVARQRHLDDLTSPAAQPPPAATPWNQSSDVERLVKARGDVCSGWFSA